MSVNIANLKAELSKYLRRVQSGGEVIVLDRSHPIARIVPYKEATPFKLEVMAPASDPKGLASYLARPLHGLTVDGARVLLEARKRR